jgi:hypothetical protein
MQEVPPEEHIHFSKVDLADGYWRMIVEESSRWNFAYVLPGPPGAPIQLVIPSALQMGWNESPAYFCSATETARDVAQAWIDRKTELPPHPMEPDTKPATAARRQTSGTSEYEMSAVYVDDFLVAAVEDRKGELLDRAARATLHAIHNVFPPPTADDAPGTKDPISVKKLLKGDAQWNTIKEVLGYELDGVARTIQLPQPKSEALLKELRKVLRKQRIPLKRFRSLVGRLQHAARILPSAKAFFTPMNEALRGLPPFIGLSRHGDLRQALLDTGAMIQELARRPTHVSELVPQDFDFVGFCDASAFGAGGVWFSCNQTLPPSVWRLEFPADITAQVVSDKNPDGVLTNSDLEMAGVILQFLALEQIVPDLRHIQVAIGCDNTPAVAWTQKMATHASSPVAYRLLRGLAMRQRSTRAAPPEVYHVAGDTNTLADVASRRIKDVPSFPSFVSNPAAFLSYFTSRFPLPQSPSWNIVHPDSNHCSNVISTLRGQRLELRRWMIKSGPKVGTIGPGMREAPTLTPTSNQWASRTEPTSSLPLPPGFALDSSERAGQLDSSPWRKPFVTSRKPSSWRGTMTPAEVTAPKSSTCRFGIS